MRVKTKRVYEPSAPEDGARVLIMRLWPRGIRKDRVSVWLRELGPVLPLLRAFRAGTVSWPQYQRRYRAGLGRPEAQAALREVRGLGRRGTVTLLCVCHDPQRCHRTLLRDALTRGVAYTGARRARRGPARRAPRPRREA
jgi:uncharacterized protein YeaO (DUF488 family)